MMPGVDSLSGDTTLLLREILQNKESKMSNNTTTTTNNNTNNNNNNNNNNNSIKSFCSNGNAADSDMIDGMLRSKAGTRDTHSVDTASVHSCCNGSVADSDVDSARGDGDVDDVVDDEKVYDDMAANDLEDSPVGDTKEAKRARVENIITSMRPSSGDHPDSSSVNSSDLRRPKRKQLQPQQHDTKFGCSEAKYHRGNHNVLHEHIMQLQHQLQVVKQRCDALCGDDVNSDVSKQVSKYSDAVRMWMKEKEMENKECNGIGYDSRPDELVIPKPGDFNNVFKAASSKALVEPEDLQQIAESVKTEIVQSITKAVDSAVNKLIEKCVLKSVAFRPPSPGVVKKCKEPEKKPESIWSEVKSNPVVSVKHDLIHDHLTNRAQDKISAFEPLHRDFELPRSHVAPHVPFPHFPYYFPTQMLPPMYASEPEQTEALPLVVSNTPKKKRTKVTDTRLSPRAKSALLQDNSPSMQLDLGHAPTSAFPHFLPHMLPTSVAIPNPSLQHSDVLGFGMRERCLSESRLSTNSPSMFDRSSPKSPDDAMNFSRSDMFEGSPSDSGDSQYLHLISFG